MTIQCCSCKKVKRGEVWVTAIGPLGISDRVTHGYCPVCVEEAWAELEKEIRSARGLQHAVGAAV